MTQQELIERDVRMAIGELSVQLIVARAEIAILHQTIAELEMRIAGLDTRQAEPPPKANGKDKTPLNT